MSAFRIAKFPKAAGLMLVICALVMPVVARADPRQDIIANAMRCGGLEGDRQWLDCFYGSAQPMRARLGLPPAPEAQTRLSGEAQSNNLEEGYGIAVPQMPQPNHVSAKLATFTLDPHGFFTVTLSNGQVWRQLSGDTTIAHWNPSQSAQYVIAINPGALGSHNLQVVGQPERYKVERLH
jgi:hypothetical protein